MGLEGWKAGSGWTSSGSGFEWISASLWPFFRGRWGLFSDDPGGTVDFSPWIELPFITAGTDIVDVIRSCASLLITVHGTMSCRYPMID